MKKTIVLFATLLLTFTASAKGRDNQYDYTRHEVALGYGVLPNSTWLGILEDLVVITSTLGNVHYDATSSFGALSGEYYYRVHKAIGIGGIGAFYRENRNLIINNNVEGHAHANYITLMPAAKFDWLRRKHFGMYSKIAFGATLRTDKQKCQGAEDESDATVLPNWQLSLLGLEAGSPNIRVFAEVGFGEQGILLAGLRYKF